MKKTSSRFAVLFVAFLSVSLQSYAQRNPERREERLPVPQTYPQPLSEYREPHYGPAPMQVEESRHERIQQTLQPYQTLRLSELLRLSQHELRQIELVTLSVSAQSFYGPTDLLILSHGQFLNSMKVRRNLNTVYAMLPAGTSLEGLELRASQDIFLESVSAQIRRKVQAPMSRLPAPYSTVSLQVNQDIYGRGEVALKKLIKQQLGLSLEGVEIQRVTVEGTALGYSQPMLQIVVNNRAASILKVLRAGRSRALLQVQSVEEIQSLRLSVTGDVRIYSITVSFGNVRYYRQQY